MTPMPATKQHILGLTAEELTARITALGMPKFRATQILEWIFAKRAKSFAEMTNLSLADRAALDERFAIFTGEVVRRQTATDGTEKILLKWPGTAKGTKGGEDHEGGDETAEARRHGDGEARGEGAGHESQISDLKVQRSGVKAVEAERAALTEAVMIPADEDVEEARGEHGRGTAARRTACLSTQVGCPVGCAFCASGLGGLESNLHVGQMVEQALHLTHLLSAEGVGHRITNVVFMGMGEPLANLEATVGAVRTLMAPWGLHIRRGRSR